MTSSNYFAYGSNMLTERLTAPSRCPGARPVGVAHVVGYTLHFHKRSIDGSGKAMLVHTGQDEDIVHGVLFEIDENEAEDLRRAEGPGYYRDDAFPVRLPGTDGVTLVTAYLAQDTHIEPDRVPYEWYRTLAVAGAHQHGLPGEWIDRLANAPFRHDPVPDRDTRLEALQNLEQAGFAHLLPQLPKAA